MNQEEITAPEANPEGHWEVAPDGTKFWAVPWVDDGSSFEEDKTE